MSGLDKTFMKAILKTLVLNKLLNNKDAACHILFVATSYL